MQNTMGDDWIDFFDLCLAGSQRPLFQKTNNPFYEAYPGKVDHKGAKIMTGEELKEWREHPTEGTKNFIGGNISILTKYFKECLGKTPRIAFLGDNIHQDIMATWDY